MRAKKPTLSQKKAIVAAGLVWENWLVEKEEKDKLTIISKKSAKSRVIPYDH